MARKTTKTTSAKNLTINAALIAEIEMNEAAAPAIIDHESQIDSWSDISPEAEAALLKAEFDSEPTVEAAAPVAPIEVQSGDFEKILASFDDDTVTAKTFKIAGNVDERVSFELDKNYENASIQRTLRKVRSELVTKRAARIMLATNIEPDFINRTLNDGSRYNVYALGKFADIVRSIVDGHGLNNAINNAVMRSLFRCKNAGIAFTGELAKAAASDKIRTVDPTIAKTLVRHTVSASTAPTQASSTMAALQTLGVVKVEGSSRNPTYRVTDNPIASFLEAKLLAA